MDPITELMKAVQDKGATEAKARDALDDAGSLLLRRQETEVNDLLESEAMAVFQQQYVEGRVESSILKQVMDIAGPILIGMLTG